VAKLLGNDRRLWIESATPGTYNMIKGQQDLSISRNATQIDTSSKDDYPYGTSAPGMRQLTINCTLFPDLPDATGYTLLETKANAAVPAAVNFSIRKNGSTGADPADVVFKGSMWIGDFNTSMDKNGVVTVTFTLTAASAPVTDVLA
jgi:predicted secreted protein